MFEFYPLCFSTKYIELKNPRKLKYKCICHRKLKYRCPWCVNIIIRDSLKVVVICRDEELFWEFLKCPNCKIIFTYFDHLNSTLQTMYAMFTNRDPFCE